MLQGNLNRLRSASGNHEPTQKRPSGLRTVLIALQGRPRSVSSGPVALLAPRSPPGSQEPDSERSRGPGTGPGAFLAAWYRLRSVPGGLVPAPERSWRPRSARGSQEPSPVQGALKRSRGPDTGPEAFREPGTGPVVLQEPAPERSWEP